MLLHMGIWEFSIAYVQNVAPEAPPQILSLSDHILGIHYCTFPALAQRSVPFLEVERGNQAWTPLLSYHPSTHLNCLSSQLRTVE